MQTPNCAQREQTISCITSTVKMTDYMLSIPSELKLKIVEELSAADLVQVAQVSRQFHEIVTGLSSQLADRLLRIHRARLRHVIDNELDYSGMYIAPAIRHFRESFGLTFARDPYSAPPPWVDDFVTVYNRGSTADSAQIKRLLGFLFFAQRACQKFRYLCRGPSAGPPDWVSNETRFRDQLQSQTPGAQWDEAELVISREAAANATVFGDGIEDSGSYPRNAINTHDWETNGSADLHWALISRSIYGVHDLLTANTTLRFYSTSNRRHRPRFLWSLTLSKLQLAFVLEDTGICLPQEDVRRYLSS